MSPGFQVGVVFTGNARLRMAVRVGPVDAVDANCAVVELGRERLRQSLDGELGHAVRTPVALPWCPAASVVNKHTGIG